MDKEQQDHFVSKKVRVFQKLIFVVEVVVDEEGMLYVVLLMQIDNARRELTAENPAQR